MMTKNNSDILIDDARAKFLIEQELYKIRMFQKGAEISDTELFRLITKIFNLTGGLKEAEMINALVVKLKTRERVNKVID
jgi:hypothetical protein